ncbi:hypothetical protein STA3757_03960 [Stanieria sp. NIES-3757]|nr:hypothetical protein STA3757_03960 [Stanieria sp. NIES-3757]
MGNGYITISIPQERKNQIKSICWMKLWRFNDYKYPQFWFGDSLFHSPQNRTGLVTGMRYVPEIQEDIMKPGWWYLINFNNFETSGHWIHEESLNKQ